VVESGVQQRRWDTDNRGRGVASAANATEEIKRLVAEMSTSDWIAEDPEIHLLPHLRSFVEREGSPWQLVSTNLLPDGRYEVRIAWVGERASSGRLRAEVFALIGSVAEPSTHVRERRTGDGVEYEVVTGMLDGDAGWTAHGHVIAIRIEKMASHE
jgi:hypothetical protein